MEQTNFLKINKPSNGKDFVIDDKFWKENPDKIDEQFRLVDAQLAEKAKQTDLNTTNANVSANTTTIGTKADKTFVDIELAKKANQTDLNAQSSRIDTLVANAGDTSNNAELLDIRTDVMGTKHTTAGNALRFGQSAQLFDYDESPLAVGYKRFLKFPYENGGFNFSTGATVTDASCVRTSIFLTLPATLRIVNSGYRYRIYKYNKADNSFNSYIGWYTDTDKTIAIDTAFTYKITIATLDASPINFEDAIKKVKFISGSDTLVLDKGLIPDIPYTLSAAFLSSPDGRAIDFDFTNQTITFPYDTCMVWKDKFYSIKGANNTDTVVSYSAAVGTSVRGYFNVKTNSFVFTNVSTTFTGIEDCVLFCSFRKDKWVSIRGKYTVKGIRPDYDEIKSIVVNVGGGNSKRSIVKSVGHQGYHVNAPNNSLPAYIESYKNGFDVADCDVQWTSDGVAVLCHDNDISTWSNGTGNITDMTYDQLLQYDFGSWKSSAYAGLKIATFKDYVKTAKMYGLDLYIEPKSGNTTANVAAMLDYIKVLGMLDRTTITCASLGVLNQCKAYSNKIRLGYITYDYQTTYIDTVKTLQSGSNYAFLFPTYTAITEQILQDIINSGIGVELWTIDDPVLIKTYAPYCSGICSNNYSVLGAVTA